MKTRIVFASMTNHTRKLAEALASSIGIKAEDIKAGQNLEKCDVMFLGTGVYAGKIAPEIEEFCHKLSKDVVGKVVFFNTSCKGEDTTSGARIILKEKGIDVHEEVFFCPGTFLFFHIGRPNKKDISSFVEFGKSILN